MRNLVATGESFVQMPIVDRRLKLKLFASEQVDTNWTRQIEDGRAIFTGVEVDAQRQACWRIGCLPYQLDLALGAADISAGPHQRRRHVARL